MVGHGAKRAFAHPTAAFAEHDNQLYFIINATRPIALRSIKSRIAFA